MKKPRRSPKNGLGRALSVATLALGALPALPLAQAPIAAAVAGEATNPCAPRRPANPCAPSKATNPCAPKPPASNPCAPKKATNPCAPKKATNPCAPKAPAGNPCAPQSGAGKKPG